MNENQIKVIISDIDGTLINDNGQLPDNFKDMLRKLEQKGVIFIAASGRSIISMENVLNHQADNLYIISDNGAVIKHKDEIIDVVGFSQSEIAEIVSAFEKTENSAIIASSTSKSYAQIIDVKYEPLIKEFFSKYKIVENINDINVDYVNVCMYSEKHNDQNFFSKEIEALKSKYSIIRAGDVWTDAMPKNINKAAGIKKLLNHLNIDPKASIAFGDYHNDIEMLKFANIGFAMQNAHNDVKEIADEVIGSNNDNSVIKKIYELMDL